MNLAFNRFLKRKYTSPPRETEKYSPVKPSDECPCVLVPRLLVAMGAVNAARMHKKGEGNNGWSVQDYRDHLSDEEVYFFPLMLSIAADEEAKGETQEATYLRNAISRLGREHGEVRREFLDNGVAPPKSVVHAHGLVEDALIVKWRPEIEAKLKLTA